MPAASKTPAAAYIRTSSLANAGEHKSSYARQVAAVRKYARDYGYSLDSKAVFYDKGISGSSPVEGRPEFGRMVAHLVEKKVTHVLMEDSSRLARDVVAQETAHSSFKTQGFTMISALHPDLFVEETPTGRLVRNFFGGGRLQPFKGPTSWTNFGKGG